MSLCAGKFFFTLSIMMLFTLPLQAKAKLIVYDLTIARQDVNYTGRSAQAMTINGGIPGPTLRFTEGDTARIHVHNTMDAETSIHWHGILVPPDMDGVPNISFPPIDAGSTYTYEFPIRQNGTYWYHSHTSLQEQSGVYGSIVIEPKQYQPRADRDYVVLLSDWTDEEPHTVLRTLKRGSEWYSIQKGSGQSILGALRLGMLGKYFKRELQRMPAMDIADVAYDRFSANGKVESSLAAQAGESIRLRIINGSATTYFHVDFASGPMQIISADGLDVQPVETKRFLIGVAETYDVLVRVPEHGAYEFRATAHDGSGYASVWLGSGKHNKAADIPQPNLYAPMGGHDMGKIWSFTPSGTMDMEDHKVESGMFDQPGMMGMDSMHEMHDMGHGGSNTGMSMNHGAHQSQTPTTDNAPKTILHAMHDTFTEPPHDQRARFGKEHGKQYGFLATDVASAKNLAIDGTEASRPSTPYPQLRAVKPTTLDNNKPVRDIRLTLDGDMERYVWLLNNKPLSESDFIKIHKGEIVRFIMINRTMMHHPMHMHGHFFRVLNGQGDHAPLKHTVDVAPMSTTVIEFDANEFGDWFFHCHLLYHMKSGMARMVHYDGFTIDQELAAVRPNLYKESWYAWAEADIANNMSEGMLTLSDTRNSISAWWESGWENVEETEWEGVLSWDRHMNRFFSLFAGFHFEGEKDDLDKTREVLGLRYLLPLNIESMTWLDSDKGGRFGLEKEFALTPRLSLTGEAEYDTHDKWESSANISYLLHKNVSLKLLWHSEFAWGAGATIRF